MIFQFGVAVISTLAVRVLAFLVFGAGNCPGNSQAPGIDCPPSWERFQDSCYLFFRSPELTWSEAQLHCREYLADLIGVETPDEHIFLKTWFRQRDPTLSTWYTSGFDPIASGEWIWTTTGSEDRRISNDDPAWIFQQVKQEDLRFVMDPALSVAPASMGRALAYNFSSTNKVWTWLPVTPDRNRPFICEIPVFLSPNIPVRERKIDYGLIVEDPAVVPAGPRISEEPNDVVFDNTGRPSRNWITMRCVAGGYPLPDYSWYRVRYEDGKETSYLIDPLSDSRFTQTDGSLTIHDPESIKDRGEYYCLAVNRYGTVISRRVKLQFGYVGDFALRRSPTQLVMYNGAAVPCDPPPNFPAVTYVWARDAFPNFVEENKRVFVSKDGNMYLSHVETSDEGTYQCVVKSAIADVGKTGPFFEIVVRRQQSVGQLKIWSSFPKLFPLSPVSGDNITIECFASGYPAPQYEWRRLGGEVMPVGIMLKKFNRVLQIPDTQIGDSGDYECKASSTQGSVSAVVRLDIKAKPYFIIPIKSQFVDAGTDVSWTCAAFGRPAVTYRWFKNGDPLEYRLIKSEDLGRYQIDGSRLIVRNVEETRDSGIYQCEATNILGTALSAGELRILALPPSFRKRPISKFLYAANGGNITIYCKPEAAPTPVIRWLFNDAMLESSPRVRVLGTGDLIISPVFQTDQGIYSCEASNRLGVDRSQGFLKVLRGPRMVETPRNEQVALNRSSVLRCSAEADPMLDVAYEWRLNNIPIDTAKNAHFYTGWKERRGYLFIREMTFSEAGEYSCVVKTPVAQVSQTARIDVIGPPGPPSGVTAIPLGISTTSVTIRWNEGVRNGLDVLHYNLEILTNHNPLWVKFLQGIVPTRAFLFNKREFDLVNLLQPWNSYKFRLIAGNFLGLSDPSPASPVFDVAPAPPMRPPLAVTGGGGKLGDLTIIWTPLPPYEQNGPGIGYRLLFRKVDSSGDFREEIINGNLSRAAFKVGNSEIYQPYEVRIRAFNNAGDGPLREAVVVYSAETTPTLAPTNVAGSPFNSTALTTTWQPLPSTEKAARGHLIGYRVKYWRRDWDQEEAWTVLVPNIETALIKGLDPFTEYFISVMAVNSAGNGPESEPFIARTYRSEPKEFPMGVRVRILDWSTIMVDWRGIMTSPQEEPILGYKIRYWRQGEDIKSAKDLVLPLTMLNGQFEAALGGLTPGQSYNLRVLGYSQGGDGRMSSPVWQFKMVVSNESARLLAPRFLMVFWMLLFFIYCD